MGQLLSTLAMSAEALGTELLFVQNQDLTYLHFSWQPPSNRRDIAEQVCLEPEQSFKPLNPEAYCERVRRILARRVPEQCNWLFCCEGANGQLTLPFELSISPILPAQGASLLVLVLGRCLDKDNGWIDSISPLPLYPEPFQMLQTSVARQIRRTLDLETIRLQTVDSLGLALQISRCWIGTVKDNALEILAEFCQPTIDSRLGERIGLTQEPLFAQAVATQAPLAVDSLPLDESTTSYSVRSLLVVGTYELGRCNGVICLEQCDRRRQWSEAELEFVTEIAQQVGTAIAHATIYRDLEIASQKATEASRLKSEFLASTTHELRTPLNGILGFLKLVLDGMADDPAEQQEFLEQSYHSALHLLNLINDILDIAKIEAGQLALELTAVSLDDLLQSVVDFTSAQIEDKQLNLQFELPATYDRILVYGNYQRLLQVLLNLVGNAIKFTRQGGITMSVEIGKSSAVRVEDGGHLGTAKISVADTGIGVPLDKQNALFDEFVQVDGSRTKTYGGTGLGLAISKKLIEAMGGQISFYSMGEGLGSTVTFTIPLAQLPVLKTGQSRKHPDESR
ncbi:MAG: ATP-binding protein [Cyanobacteria bacterium P01_H01_bin.15]